MAGLLDALTNLTPDQNQGLLALAASLLQAGGPSTRPTSLGQALGGGLQAFQQGQQAAQDRAYQQQLRTLQLDEAKSTADERRRQRELEANIREAALAAYTPATQAALAGGGGPTLANAESLAANPEGVFNQAAFLDRVSGFDPLQAMKLAQSFVKQGPEYDTKINFLNGPDGRPIPVLIGKGGQVKRLEGFTPREKSEFLNLGGKEVAVNPYDVQPGQQFQRTLTPGEAARLDQEQRQFNARNAAGTQKPLPASALKLQQSELDALSTASGIQSDLARVQNQLETGKLSFGPISNLINQGRNLAGVSNEESRNFASFKSTLEKLRNDSLRLNAGVQTDGDAQRAWNELFANITDKGVVEQRLREIQGINARAVQLRKLNIDGIRANYGYGPLDTSAYEKAAGAQPARPSADSGAKTISLADIAETARRSGRTTAEVTAAARAKGYKIEGN